MAPCISMHVPLSLIRIFLYGCSRPRSWTLENSAEVSDPELVMQILTASHGDCSHSCMSTSICIYSMRIKIFDFMNVKKMLACAHVYQISCWAMQLCSFLNLYIHSRDLLDRIRKHREWVSKCYAAVVRNKVLCVGIVHLWGLQKQMNKV